MAALLRPPICRASDVGPRKNISVVKDGDQQYNGGVLSAKYNGISLCKRLQQYSCAVRPAATPFYFAHTSGAAARATGTRAFEGSASAPAEKEQHHQLKYMGAARRLPTLAYLQSLFTTSAHTPPVKRHPAFEAALQVSKEVMAFIAREVYVSYRFVSYDLTVTVLPGTLLTLVTHMKGANVFGVATTMIQRAPLWQSLASSFVWMWMFVYVITLANQTHGGTEGGEDALNKPTRPIPSGLVSVEGGYQRLVWVCTLFVMLGAHLKIGLLSAAWVANVLTLECWGPSCTSLHWLIKPIAMMVGIFIICVGNPSLVNPIISRHTPTLLYMFAISLAMGLLGSSIQDIRDVEGDRMKGDRLSLPILLGDGPARHLCNFLLLCSWGTLHTALMALPGPFNLATSIAILLWCLFLCTRTLLLRSPAEDHKTYLAFVYLYSFLLLSYSWVV